MSTVKKNRRPLWSILFTISMNLFDFYNGDENHNRVVATKNKAL